MREKIKVAVCMDLLPVNLHLNFVLRLHVMVSRKGRPYPLGSLSSKVNRTLALIDWSSDVGECIDLILFTTILQNAK